MSLPRYAEYKASGSPWFGTVPRHWGPTTLKHIVAYVESGVSVNAVDEPAGPESLGVLKTSCVYAGVFDPRENKTVLLEEIERVSCPVKAGTLIVSRMNTPALVGAAGLVTESIANLFLPDRLWQVHFANAEPKFVHYWTNTPSYRAQVQMACAGTSASMQNLSQDEFLRFTLPLPSKDEQAAIAGFLDRETAKIDALIAEQEKLIALLAEKRQATISQAVTKGLNPTAPTKNSSVAWLGEVPTHWKVGKTRFYVSVLPGYAFSSAGFSIDECDVKLLRGINVAVGELKWDEVVYWKRTGADGLAPFELKAGDVVIGMDRPLISSGMRVATVKQEDLPCMLLQRVAKIQPGPLIDGRFIMRLLSSRAFEAHFTPDTTGVSVPHISGEQISSFVIPVPPLEEQLQICGFLDAELAKLDALNREAGRTITLLGERRSGLITAAVTGQIDVRDSVPLKLAA